MTSAGGSSGVHLGLNPVGGFVDVFVLPNPNDEPADPSERRGGTGVSIAIGLNLVGPPVGVVLREREVRRAAVPEAAIDEDCDPARTEHDIGASSAGWVRATVDSEPQPTPMELTSESDLRLRVPPALALEAGADVLVERLRDTQAPPALDRSIRSRLFQRMRRTDRESRPPTPRSTGWTPTGGARVVGEQLQHRRPEQRHAR